MTARNNKTIDRRFDSPEQETYLSLWRTYDRLRTLEDELFVDFDLTAQQYNVLRLLRSSHPDLVPTLSLVGRLVSRAPDVTRMLDKLEEIRLGLLLGTIPQSRLEQLAHLVRAQREQVNDPKLTAILDEIELRAAVELAKLTRSGG